MGRNLDQYRASSRGNGSRSNHKDYAGDYLRTVQQDWVSDLYNLWYPLRNVMIQIFKTPSADGPVADAEAALAQFRVALDAYVAHGMDLDITDYLQAEATDENGQLKPDCLMSAADNPEKKVVTLPAPPPRDDRAALLALGRAQRAKLPPTPAEEARVDALLNDLTIDLMIHNAQRGL